MSEAIYEVGQTVVAVDVPHDRPWTRAYVFPRAGTRGRIVRINASDYLIQWADRDGSDVAFAEEFAFAPKAK